MALKDIVAAPSQPPKRHLGWMGLVIIAFGSANLSLMVISSLITTQGTSAIPFLIASLVISLMGAFGYLELVLMYPNKTGGISNACVEAFAPYNPLLSNIAGTGYWFAWLIATCFGAQFTSSAIQHYFLPNISTIWLSTIIILAATAICLCGLSVAKRIIFPIALAAALLALLSSLIPVLAGTVNWQQATSYSLIVPFPGVFGHFTSAMAAIYILGWVTPAFENALCYVNETIDPARNVKRAYFITFGISLIYYLICPIIWLGVLTPAQLSQSLIDLSPTYAPFFMSISKEFAALFIITNMLCCVMAPLCSTPRTLAQLAADGLAPKFIDKYLTNGAPWVATLISASVIIWLIWIETPTWFIAATNFQYLLCLSLTSIAVALLRYEKPHAERLYRAPKGFIMLGLISAGIWTTSTIFGFQQYGFTSLVSGIVFSFSGTLLYLWRKIADRRQNNQQLIPDTLHIRLTGTMLMVLLFDTVGYLIAIRTLGNENSVLIVMLEDIFVLVAILTLSIGLVIPGMICNAADEVNNAVKNLMKGTLHDITTAMRALGEGDLDNAKAEANIQLVNVRTRDEIGEMAANFNNMQIEIATTAESINNARESLKDARAKLIHSNQALHELNVNLEERVGKRTSDLENANQNLQSEINVRTKAEIKVALLNQQLIIAARRAGMAEIATSVLHNVGNVLNSVNTSFSLVHEKLMKTKLSGLNELAKILKQEENLAAYFSQPEKAENISNYISQLAELWQTDKAFLLKEMILLNQSIEHINHIIIAQQSFGKTLGFVEKLKISEIIQDALMLTKNVAESHEIIIDKSYHFDTPISVDRVKLLQIITNIIKNSIDALSESNVTPKKVIIRTEQLEDNLIQISISDNGIGIAPDSLLQIFSHGFTTKKTGHGFGLHMSALSIKELGGTLIAESEGLGKGATFIMTLPIQFSRESEHNKEHTATDSE